MKKRFLTLIAGACCFMQVQAQTQNVSLSTGVNNSTGALIALNTNDDTWQASTPLNPTTFNPVKCVNPYYAWATNPNSRWVSTAFYSNGDPMTTTAGYYTYKMTFNVSACTITSALMTFAKYAADNKLDTIRVNGHIHVLSPPASFSTMSGPTLITSSLAGELVTGTNTVTVNVYNEPSTITGLNIDGYIQVNYQPDPNLTPAISGSSSFCTGDALSFTGSTTGSSSASTHKWSIFESDAGGVAVAGGYSFNSTTYSGTPGSYTFPTTPGCGKYYTVKLGVANTCGWVYATKTIFINCNPIAEAGPDKTVCPGSCVTIGTTNSTSGRGVTYKWVASTGPSGLVIGTTQTLTVCPTTATTYTLTVTNAAGCTSTDVVTVTIYCQTELTKDPNGNTQATTRAASIETTNALDPMTVYPNPGTGLFTINVGQSQNGVLDVYDVLGNKVQSIRINANTTDYKLDLSGYSKGIYMLNMISGDQRYSKKIILE